MSRRAIFGFGGFIIGFGLIAGITFFSVNTDMERLKENAEPLVTITTLGAKCDVEEETPKYDSTGITCKQDVHISKNGAYQKQTLTPDELTALKKTIESSNIVINTYDLRGCEDITLAEDISFSYPDKYEQPFRLCEIPNWQSYPLLTETAELLNSYHAKK